MSAKMGVPFASTTADGRQEGVGRDDDLVARLDARGQQRQPERDGPVRDRDGVRRALVRGERCLECSHLVAVQPAPVAAAQGGEHGLFLGLVEDRPGGEPRCGLASRLDGKVMGHGVSFQKPGFVCSEAAPEKTGFCRVSMSEPSRPAEAGGDAGAVGAVLLEHRAGGPRTASAGEVQPRPLMKPAHPAPSSTTANAASVTSGP